jgi:hypothetical protein
MVSEPKPANGCTSRYTPDENIENSEQQLPEKASGAFGASRIRIPSKHQMGASAENKQPSDY